MADVLEVAGLRKEFGPVVAVDDVSFRIVEGGSMAIVGESGSGKSTLLQLLSAQLEASAGRVLYRMRDGVTRDLAALGEAERRFLFRTDWGYVHQDPAMGLRMRVSAGANVGERLMAVGARHYGNIRATATSWLGLVGLDERQINARPGGLSGGQRQRVAIARALAAEPRLVILDESVAALDVSIQAQVLNLLAEIRQRTGVSFLLISHDLAVVRQLTDEAIVMHRGQVVERGATAQILDDPQHEYTRRLRASVPTAGWKPVRRARAPVSADVS